MQEWRKFPSVDQGGTGFGWSINRLTDKGAKYVGWVQDEEDADAIINALNAIPKDLFNDN